MEGLVAILLADFALGLLVGFAWARKRYRRVLKQPRLEFSDRMRR